MENTYEDNVLIKLRRAYGKDEAVAALNKKVSELELENGALKSEIDHLNHELKKGFQQKEKDIRRELYQTEFKNLTKSNVTKDKTIQKKQKVIQDLIIEINKLKGIV
ncbi:hypothetical protein [Salinimicrobium sp. GXAS 041]|uniref:hypothetical protein n=1 Tax=Salinimicrobium sp. GXAS 041 TaxID=3400806 RepID=UPI003C7531CD